MLKYSVFFNDTATTEIYTLSLHDALPISFHLGGAYTVPHMSTDAYVIWTNHVPTTAMRGFGVTSASFAIRSEEHTSELQSRQYLVCRLLLEKKNQHTQDGQQLLCRHSGSP